MLYSRSRARSRLARRLSWLVVLSITSVALFAPGVTTSALAGTTITHPTGNPSCTSLGYEFEFKIDSGDLEERAYEWDEGAPVVSDWTGQTITTHRPLERRPDVQLDVGRWRSAPFWSRRDRQPQPLQLRSGGLW